MEVVLEGKVGFLGLFALRSTYCGPFWLKKTLKVVFHLLLKLNLLLH
jgi:hypothetical protein